MSYTPNEWQRGDVVTSKKLNRMEQGIAESGGGGGWDVIIKLELSYDEHNEASLDSYEIVGSTFAEIYAKLKNGEPVSGHLIEHDTLTLREGNAMTGWTIPIGFNVDPYSPDAETTLTNTIVFYGGSGLPFKWTAEGVDFSYI